MSLIVKKSGQSLPAIEPDLYNAICYAIIDLGTHHSEKYNTDSHRVLFIFELPDCIFEKQDEKTGRTEQLPRVISQNFGATLSEKGTLRSFLESWRGNIFTEEELEGFDLKDFLGGFCRLNIGVKPKSGGGQRNAIMTVVRAKAGYNQSSVNPTVYYDIDENGLNIPDGIPDWVKEEIGKSIEIQALKSGESQVRTEEVKEQKPLPKPVPKNSTPASFAADHELDPQKDADDLMEYNEKPKPNAEEQKALKQICLGAFKDPKCTINNRLVIWRYIAEDRWPRTDEVANLIVGLKALDEIPF
jgi:hypothetical protein